MVKNKINEESEKEIEKTNKEEKKKNIPKYETSEQEEMKKFIIVILIVSICVGLVYLITRAFVTKDLFNNKTETQEKTENVEINYDVAIMGEILNRPYDEYYVIIFDSKGTQAADMTNLISKYNSEEKHLHIYRVDLSNELNKEYYDKENVSQKFTSLKEFKVGDTTLLKVKNSKVELLISDYSKMEKELKVS